ncbi:MAG: hypothetical protein KDK65_07090, partial [Chlamydiia bacterium]|nr:hypothetical protein [Chlamydiia bacterium]
MGETKAKAKTKTKKKAPTQPPLNPSPALQQVVGQEPLSRPEAVKKLWDYIK